MKNAVFVMLAILGMAGAFFLGTYYPAQKCAKPAAPLDGAFRSLLQQTRCDERAATFYRSEKIQPKPGQTSGYFSHYDPKRGRCFVLTTMSDFSGGTDGHTSSTYQMVNDAFSGTSYGSSSFSQDTTNPQNSNVTLCETLPDGVHLKSCRSQDEWTAYVRTFGISVN